MSKLAEAETRTGLTLAEVIETRCASLALDSAEDRARLVEVLIEYLELPPAKDRAHSHLSNILARIHRDGGQHVDDHDVERSVEAADLAVADAYAKLDAMINWFMEHRFHLPTCATEGFGGECARCDCAAADVVKAGGW